MRFPIVKLLLAFLSASGSLVLLVPNQVLHGQAENKTLSQTVASTAGSYQIFLPLVANSVVPVPLSSKKGVGLTYRHCEDVNAMGAAWQYGWTTDPVACSNVENVPMIWGGHWSEPISGNSAWIMGFNEPDQPSQANLSSAQAATLWRQIELKYPGRRLLAPAPSTDHPEWLVDFRNAYISQFGTPPRLDGLAVHCYKWTAQECIALTQWFIGLAEQWQSPEVWVTEFAFFPCYGFTVDEMAGSMSAYVTWLDSQPLVKRYAWWASRIQGTEPWALSPLQCNTPLVDYSSGSMMPLGTSYARLH